MNAFYFIAHHNGVLPSADHPLRLIRDIAMQVQHEFSHIITDLAPVLTAGLAIAMVILGVLVAKKIALSST